MLLLWLFLVIAIGRTCANFDHQVEYQCIQHCPLQNRTDAGHYDYACDYGCNINQCNKGCKLWRRALNSSCPKVCNGPMDRLTPKALYCVMGCNDAMTKYFNQLKSKLLTPPAPALVADTLSATSLRLEWNFPEAKRVGLTYHVQWKYEELTATWHYCRNVTWFDNDTVLIENLQPYTKYRFRIVLILGHQENQIVSNPSVVISTLASGIPVSPPSSVRVAPIDSTRISVSWEPGPFPHGPLLSYVLQITDNHPDAEVPPEVKDIPAENNFYMFRNLRPARNYTISIKMRNGVGSGPSAKVTVSTPSESLVKDTQQPVLILGTEHGVVEEGTDILDEPAILYSTKLTIKGIGIHISKKLIFISDSDGNIIKMPLSRNNTNYKTYNLPHFRINQTNFMPLDLSIDWLNDQLYILGETKNVNPTKWLIARCDLDGGRLTTAVAGLTTQPYNIEVDPYNGYLFLGINGTGLYRLDLYDISNGIKHDVQPVLILNEKKLNMSAFTVDHTNFRLFVSNEREKTINTVSLDGKEIVNVRPNVIKSKLENVVSLATANKKFYWTNGDDIFYEEYHNSVYFHNSYPDLSLSTKSYKKVIINLQSSQPIPSPVNPPTNVQAIFGSNIAKTTWQPPHLLGIQGKGAWQNWLYEIEIKEVGSQKFISHKNINTTSYKISGLRENTEYVIKAAAYTKSGKGPWSSEFRGFTLSRSKNPMIYWSAAEGLLRTDAAGENVETLIHKSSTKNSFFIDMTWYQDLIYLVTNDSHVYWYNTRTHSQGQLIGIDSVGSIAVDWIGKKLYWSNPKRQMIIRGNLNGTQQEPLPILTLAKELNIDSIKAYLYWSTGFAVRCAHLNGENSIEYHPVQLFSGRQVMGLTLDIHNKFVYWIVRGLEGSNLFRAPMAGYTQKITVEKISSLQKPNMQGPLCYFHKRLLWLQDNKNAAISDLQGKNIATFSGKSMSDLTLVYVVDSSLHVMPDIPQIVVIPETVDKNSVRIVGSLNSFNVTWNPVKNVNYGQVFYEVSIDSLSRNDSAIITNLTSVKYWQQVAPFTKLQVAIRAFTYWGTSPQIRAKVYSPASTPTVPRNLRAYVTHHNSGTNVTITVRWDAPMFPNGVLKGYKIHCWYLDHSQRRDVCQDLVKKPEEFQIDFKPPQDQIYYFNVQAFSEMGDGDLSDPIQVNSSEELPLPRLLVASEDSIFIQDIDSDCNESLLHGIVTPTEIGYLIKESKLFWIDQLQNLMMFDMLKSNKTKITSLKNNVTGLTVDWLERSIYYAQSENWDSGSSVFKLNLNYVDRGIIKMSKIFFTPASISKIEVSPYTKMLYWVEKSKLMVCNTDGSDRREFFNKDKYTKRSILDESCNCPVDVNIEKTYTLDHSTETKPLLVFIDSDTHNVVSADKNGCSCSVIANNSLGVTLPLDRLKSDFGTLYWTNSRLLHALRKKEANLVTKEVNGHDILIFGPHMQPFPPAECLRPQQYADIRVTLKEKTSTSLTLLMPEVGQICVDTSMPTIEYRIYYTEKVDDNTSCDFTCNFSSTFDKEFRIKNLKPFTHYVVAVTVSNYYTKDDEVVLGASTVFQTAIGAPSPPQNVTVKVLNPTMAQVSWSPPQYLNGVTVHYEIYCQTERTLSGVRQKEQSNVEQQFTPNSTHFLTIILNKLSSNETYTIWVKAYSETNETSSDSEKVQINTYPEPSDLILVNRTAYMLVVTWEVCANIDHYNVQFSPVTSNEWKNMTQVSDGIFASEENLKPKTEYKFRLSLFYYNYPEEYVWPQDSRFIYETLGDKPSPPGTPKIQYVKPNIYKVWWEEAKDNGAPIELYKLEGLELPNYRTKRSTNRTAFFYTAPSIEEEEREWQQFYNGTETSWIINGLSEKYKYEFRVSALNAYGWSDPSDSSTAFDLNEAARMAEKQSPMTLIAIATFIPVSVFLIILLCLVCRKYGKPKKVQVVSIPRGPDVELATLRELPRRGVHNTNVLYVSTQPTSEEMILLPHIRRDQITLMKFLGSGAFGEVFEGKARGIPNSSGDTKVAVKTLRKCASDQEKAEFLQEAQLMSNFKHEHILQLLGVCLDNDPHFIIMELMQGGDLLTYLRSSRNPNTDTPSLSLIELLKMCVDVAKGCRYLEEMHFVHRDLACRNCLVSSKDPDRIVKIGDFGLARDIYKNDYYRKEGEGLLPVRWMAPESLVDGVFTSQSDVWAFGVLLWEIMTLGQQPYPARNNLEVLHYVRRGGRLGKPTDCPEALHNLMLKCWEFEAEKRPTFKYCLDVLDNLHLQNLRSPTTGAHEGQYISTVQEYFIQGISNEAYFRDENFSGDIEDDANKEKTPFLASEATSAIPKYLELLYEPDTPPANDGYEIPNQMLQNESTTKRSSSIVSISSNGNVPEKKIQNASICK
ncbi:proto-oncogene tyrosine-protein kinase ROS isoform X1 [Tribolium madens]|uniref:proto-oncogene tyrosine-protein kinase ROS isoform X1 n=1 Tax=Tribolium madens TaxID=41895 RepID=UPI001CF72398|nr:proto-oncogene tyrosine-protein kinase ROS isoform X1 [Tribolium madens]